MRTFLFTNSQGFGLDDLARLQQTRNAGHPLQKVKEMDLDDDEVKKKASEYFIGEDLSTLSIEELHERITAHEGEIVRLQRSIEEKERVKSNADNFFRA